MLSCCPCPGRRCGEMLLRVGGTLWWCSSALPVLLAKGSLEELSCRQALEDVGKLYSSFDGIIPLLENEKSSSTTNPAWGL